MKRTILAFAVGVAAAIGLAPAASAQLYIGGGYTAFQADDVLGEDPTVGTVMGRIGYEFNDFIGIEGEAAIGVQDESYNILGTNVDVGVESEFGGFVVGRLGVPLLGDFFARAGYATIEIEASGGGTSFTEDGDGFAYGGGLEFNILVLRARLEYTRYEVDDGDLDSLGISALLHF